MSTSQRQIQANYQAINSIFSANHVALNADTPGKSQGMHNVMTLRAQTGDPTTTADQVALYSKIVSNQAMLFFRPCSNQTPIQLTYPSISTGILTTDPDVYLPQQYTFLAGPFVVYLGEVNVVDGDTVTLLPSTTLLYVGLIQKGSLGGSKCSAAATNIAGNQFVVRLPSNSAPFWPVFYMAIGKP